MLGTFPLAARVLVAAPRPTRPSRVAAVLGEFGWTAWSFSRQAKLNAWAWHGVGADNLNAWATLGGSIYVRKETDSGVHVMTPDTFLGAEDASTDSQTVDATTQWLDFKSPGKRKALTGIDIDCQNVQTVEVYVSDGGDRAGVLAETIAVGDAQGGWTYSGEMLPLSCDGTEFKLRFVAHPLLEAQVNRVTLHWSELAG